MLNVDKKLIQRALEGKPIQAGIVGAGQMGRGMISQMVLMQGMRPAIVSDIMVENAVNCFLSAGLDQSDIVKTNVLSEANTALEQGKYVATEDAQLVAKANAVDCVIDATGVPDVGAQIAVLAMQQKKHVVMLNVETDVVIGPYLYQLAQEHGVIYTGSAGDEPGAVMELYSFAKAMGFDVKVIGKGKNNALAFGCTPDTVREEALRRGMSPRMLCAFKDGTKTMVELAAMCNATGFVPDVMGGHGISSDVMGLNEKFRLKQDGGVLSRHGVVDFVNGIAPGVFVTVSTENPDISAQLTYLSMGDGPLFTFYRPYHLCSLETPLSVAKAVIDHEPTIVPTYGLVAECVTFAKRDLKAGETIDGIGGYTTYGLVTTAEAAAQNSFVPYGLITNQSKMLRPVKKDSPICLEDVALDTSTQIYKLRKAQDEMNV